MPEKLDPIADVIEAVILLVITSCTRLNEGRKVPEASLIRRVLTEGAPPPVYLPITTILIELSELPDLLFERLLVLQGGSLDHLKKLLKQFSSQAKAAAKKAEASASSPRKADYAYRRAVAAARGQLAETARRAYDRLTV